MKLSLLNGQSSSIPFYVGNYRGASLTEGVVGTAYGSSLYHVKPDSLTGGAIRMTEAGAATSSVRSFGNGVGDSSNASENF